MIESVDIAISQELIDRAYEALYNLAEAIRELCDIIVQAWQRFVKAIGETCWRVLDWVRDVAKEAERHPSWPTIARRAPRTLGRNNAMRTRQVRQWRWSPMCGRR